MSRRRSASKAVTIGGLAAVGTVVTFMILLYVGNARNNEFKRSIDGIALDAIELTRQFQAQEGRWLKKQIDNTTMVSTIDSYEPRYQALIDRAAGLDAPDKYKQAKDYLIRAIEAEKQGNIHLRNYILGGSSEEYQRSIDFVSVSLQYSAEYDAAMKAAG